MSVKMVRGLGTLLAILLCCRSAIAQGIPTHTNLQAYQSMAVDCLAPVVIGYPAVVVVPSREMPYLSGPLLQHLRDLDKTVLLADSVAHDTLLTYHTLAFQVQGANVQYHRANRRRLGRELKLDLGFVLLAPSREVLRFDNCSSTFEDFIHRRELSKRESTSYPETVGIVPDARWPRRFVEPVVLIAATALTTFLFFNLRSESPSSG